MTDTRDDSNAAPILLAVLLAVLIAVVVTFVAFQLGVREGHDDARCPTAQQITLYGIEAQIAENWFTLADLAPSAADRHLYHDRGVKAMGTVKTAIDRFAPGCYSGGS